MPMPSGPISGATICECCNREQDRCPAYQASRVERDTHLYAVRHRKWELLRWVNETDRQCVWCRRTFRAVHKGKGQPKKYCSESCSRKEANAVRKARRRGEIPEAYSGRSWKRRTGDGRLEASSPELWAFFEGFEAARNFSTLGGKMAAANMHIEYELLE